MGALNQEKFLSKERIEMAFQLFDAVFIILFKKITYFRIQMDLFHKMN